ncbi:MAG: potassium channel family protein [Oribacterium sp.]|nr:potassium channel family protein [Oribacterium sp.]
MDTKKSFRRRISDLKIRLKLYKKRVRNPEFSKRLSSVLAHYITVFLGIMSVYLMLLLLLIRAEMASPDASIQTLGQAVWYSLTTFTTVGYGDLYPVTPAGKVVSSIFLLIGISLLGFFVGFTMDFIARMRPVVTLTMKSDRPWYIFTAKTVNAMLFAENLKKVRPNAMIIYASTINDDKNFPDLCVSWTPEALLDRRGSLYDAHLMCTKDNDMDNFLDAVGLADFEVPIICFSSFTPAYHPMNINFFSLDDCTARAFWQQYPVKKNDEEIVIIGFDKAGQMMLDRALELNVVFERQKIRYHVFGDSSEYCRNRKMLGEIVSLNQPSEEMDSVFFHNELWNEDGRLLCTADRIVLCSDSEEENIKILHTIQTFFAIRGNLYIYNSNVRGIATSFGRAENMLTPAYVLHNRLTDMAMCRHEMFRFMVDESIPMWEDLNSLSKDMNYLATDHISMKVRILLGDEAPDKSFDELDPKLLRKAYDVFQNSSEEEKEVFRKIEHTRNMRFYKLHNFTLGDAVDDDKRINMMMRPYEELGDVEKQAIDISWMLLNELASHKEAKRGSKK